MAKERFLVTDVTRMTPTTVCVAGFVRDASGQLQSVRPVFGDGLISEDWLHHLPRVIRPFSVIELAFGSSTPDPPHIEDRVMYEGDVEHRGEIGVLRREKS